jgi:hypothetical protein
MSDDEEEGYIRKAVEAFKTLSPSGKVPVGVSSLIKPNNGEAKSIVVLRSTIREISALGRKGVSGIGT